MEKANQALLDDVKKIIKSLLIPHQNGLNHFQLNNEYEEMEGSPIPFKNLGFSTYLDFLRSINDTVKFDHNKGGQCVLFPVVDVNTAHIQKLVKEQKSYPIKRKYDPYSHSELKKSKYELSNLASSYHDNASSLHSNQSCNSTFAHHSRLNSQDERVKFKFDHISSALLDDNETNCKQSELENKNSSYDKFLEQDKIKQKSLASTNFNYNKYLEDKYSQKEEMYLQQKAESLRRKILDEFEERHSKSRRDDEGEEQMTGRSSKRYLERTLEERRSERNAKICLEEERSERRRYEERYYEKRCLEERSEERDEKSRSRHTRSHRSPHRSDSDRRSHRSSKSESSKHRSESSSQGSNSKERSPSKPPLKEKESPVKEAPKKVDSGFQTEESYLADNSKLVQVEPDSNNMCDKKEDMDICSQTEVQPANSIEEGHASTAQEVNDKFQFIGDPRIRKRLSNSEFASDSQWYSHDYIYSSYTGPECSNVYTNRDPRLRYQLESCDTHFYPSSYYDPYSYPCDCTHCSPHGTVDDKGTQYYDYNYFNCNSHMYDNFIYIDAPVIPEVSTQQVPENHKNDSSLQPKKKLSLLDYKARQSNKTGINSQNKSKSQPDIVVTIPIEPTQPIADPRLLTKRVHSLANTLAKI